MLRGVALSAALATVMAAAVIVADFIIRYPKDLNVPPPPALWFYPVIGLVPEIAFHVGSGTTSPRLDPLARAFGENVLFGLAPSSSPLLSRPIRHCSRETITGGAA